MTVADVEVEDAAAGREQRLDLLTEAGEVGGVERRLDLAPVPNPVLPAHARDPTAAATVRGAEPPNPCATSSQGWAHGTRSRAMKNPLVPWTWGSVWRNSGRVGWRNCGQASASEASTQPRGVTAASTTASASSRFTVQTE